MDENACIRIGIIPPYIGRKEPGFWNHSRNPCARKEQLPKLSGFLILFAFT
jgi:hypothetical protein